MADSATESTNKVAQPADAIGDKAPPTPPETQAGAETNVPHPSSSALPTAAEPADTKTKILEPEDPNDTGPGLSNSELKRAESTAAAPAPQEDPQKSPKPVSVEEVLDEGLSAAQPVEVEDTVKSGGGAVDPVEPSTEHIEDVKMTDASQDGTANPAAPSSKQTEGADPADALQAETTITQKSPLSEPLAGDKRKAEQVNSANGGTAQDGFRSDEPTEKKRKSNDLATNGAAKKVGRPKKEQKKAPVPGKTARRTRSQGAPNQI